LVYQVKKTDLQITDYLDRMVADRKPKGYLPAEEIMRLSSRVAKWFFFHKQQTCLARSLALYYYLWLYGHRPYFIIDIDLNNPGELSAHTWVSTSDRLEEELGQSPKRLHHVGSSRVIIREKNLAWEGADNGQYNTNQPLQPTMSILFRAKNDEEFD
jgi:hypothetical protein